MFNELLDIKCEKCVYVLENEFGLVKIGITNNPYIRLNSILNAGGANIIKYIVKDCVNDNARIEKIMHNKFDKYRYNGEWFKGCEYDDVVEYFNEVIIQNENRQKIYNIINTYGYNAELGNINRDNILDVFDKLCAICFINHIDEEKYENLFNEIVNKEDTNFNFSLKINRLKYEIRSLLLTIGFEFVETHEFVKEFFKTTIGLMKLSEYKAQNIKPTAFTYKQIEEHLKNKYIKQISFNQ